MRYCPCMEPRRLLLLSVFLLTIGLFLTWAPAAWSDAQGKSRERLRVLEKAVPEDIADLKLLQEQVRTVLQKALPATVGVRSGSGSGSGVIVSKDGYVLTAAHVIGQPNRDITVILQDGRRLKAKSLGLNRGVDSGLIKITQEGEWPFVEMGKSAELTVGQWCIAAGHPGGFKQGRTPPVRLGRVLRVSRSTVTTDCTLVGGDSGGPLFDLQGRVIGIHSRISGPLTSNMHVAVDNYRDTWDRMVKGEAWGGWFARGPSPGDPFLGVQGDLDAKECKIIKVVSGSPADKAGLKVDDVITMFDGQAVRRFEDLLSLVQKKKPGDRVRLMVLRGEETVELRATIGKRGRE